MPNSQQVEADGMTYTACGGAIRVPNEATHSSKSYEVIFTDPQGMRHDLKRVKNAAGQKFLKRAL